MNPTNKYNITDIANIITPIYKKMGLSRKITQVIFWRLERHFNYLFFSKKLFVLKNK